MPVLNVALIGSEELARSLGKRGDVRDIESYVHKEERDGNTMVLSFLRPLRHPERLRPLLSVLNVAKFGIIEIQRVDSALGEAMVALGCSGIEKGHAIISSDDGGWIDSEQVRILLNQAGLGDWEIHDGEIDEHAIREELFVFLENSASEREKLDDSPLVLPVDQHFNVKGVGLVAIGYVQAGSVSKHDEVEVLPDGEFGVARSLQVMDDDVDHAFAGDRVGLALRNLREQSLHRGCMITKRASGALSRHDKSEVIILNAPFQKRQISVGDVVHAAVDLQFVVGRVHSTEGDLITIIWDAPLWIRSDNSSNVVIAQLDAEPMRLMGTVSHIEHA
ncbi:MAG TPA: hypothetical protein QF703_00465 [Candidatus Thalassarchaeaceae archaeon]|nr:hypothetical protein [Candidatus Thalassarchaeaceae archaeon]